MREEGGRQGEKGSRPVFNGIDVSAEHSLQTSFPRSQTEKLTVCPQDLTQESTREGLAHSPKDTSP